MGSNTKDEPNNFKVVLYRILEDVFPHLLEGELKSTRPEEPHLRSPKDGSKHLLTSYGLLRRVGIIRICSPNRTSPTNRSLLVLRNSLILHCDRKDLKGESSRIPQDKSPSAQSKSTETFELRYSFSRFDKR